MHLLASSVFVLLLVQISVSVLEVNNTKGIPPAPDTIEPTMCPNHCEGTFQHNVIQVSPTLFPKCTYNIGRCIERLCDRTSNKPCIKKCHAKKVWTQAKCCRSFWVLKTKRCKCSPFPFVDPPKPEEGMSLAEDNASNKKVVDNLFCPSYKCIGTLLDNEIQVAPNLLPECTYNQQRCRKQKCGEPKPHTKPCQWGCYPRKVWKEVRCCRIFWVMKTKKCKCSWKPWPILQDPFSI